MNQLLVETAFPRTISANVASIEAHINMKGELPADKALSADQKCDANMLLALHLMTHDRHTEAARHIDTIIYDESAAQLPPMQRSWLWLVRMTLFIENHDPMLGLAAAESSLSALVEVGGKKREEFQAMVASLLYNLAAIHHDMGEDSRATKELTRSQKLFERLVKKDEKRYGAMLVYAVEASTDIFKSRLQQMNALAHYQSMTELYTGMLTEDGGDEATRQALESLIDSLAKEGDIMLQMGNGRNAVKYYTKALRYQKKLSNTMGHKELTLSIGLARGLMKLINRRAAAEQLLNSLLPLAQRLGAKDEAIEITNLMNNQNKNFSIMTLLKSIFVMALVALSAIGINAQQVVGHRGSVWGVENTRAAFINGAQKGAWGLECDIHTTSDGAWVICHDGNMSRLGGPATGFSQMTVEQVLNTKLQQTRAGITYVGNLMTLGEYLDLCNELKVVPVIEIKGDQCTDLHTTEGKPEETNVTGVPKLIDLLKQKGVYDKAVIISFMPDLIVYLHKNYPTLQVQVLAGDKTIEYWQKWCLKNKIDLDAHFSLINKEIVDALHKAGLKVNAWTVDGTDEFKRLQDLGVDFITTNAIFPK